MNRHRKSRPRLRLQRLAGLRDAASAGQRHRLLGSATDPLLAALLRRLCHLPQRREVRRHDLRPPDLRLSGSERSSVSHPDRSSARRTTDSCASPQGWALLFHPTCCAARSWGATSATSTFFSYEVREALHLSEQAAAHVSSNTACTTSATSCSTPSTATAAR